MADKTTTNFPKMGDSAHSSWENVSGRPDPGKRTPRQGYSMVEAATANSRRQVHERLGHQGAITAKMVYENSPESGATLSRTYTVPSTGGQFWAKRQFGQAQQ